MSLYHNFTYKAYTLIELLLVLLLFVVILGTTIPRWQLLLQNNTSNTQANKVVTTLEYTRILSIKQNKNIALCRKNFRDGKNSKNWSDGQVVVDKQNTSGATVLHVFSAIPNSNDRLFWNSSFKKNDCIEFTPLGILEGQQGSFYYCHNQKQISQALAIVLQQTGNVYVHVLAKCPKL
jgi:type IV fimbrial biogenesis protein FimT